MPFLLNFFGQSRQWKGCSPECTLRWVFNLEALLHSLPQSGQRGLLRLPGCGAEAGWAATCGQTEGGSELGNSLHCGYRAFESGLKSV